MTFDHRVPGTSASAWDDVVDELPGLVLPYDNGSLIVLAAHPDDETLGAGGLIASAEARGWRVCVVVATDGEASHPASTTHRPDRLADMRRREVYAAVAALAPGAEVRLLGLPDGTLEHHVDELARELEKLARPGTLIASPWIFDRHPDHEACAAAAAGVAARRSLRHWQFPIWAWHWDDPATGLLVQSDPHVLALEDEALAAKKTALDCHRSQHSDLSDAVGDERLLPLVLTERAGRPVEMFVVTGGTDTPVDYFEQLYRDADDPWGLDTRFYEQRKRAAVLAALPRPRFRRAFEPGCATGAVTVELARRCDEVVAWDVVDSAVAATGRRVNESAIADTTVVVDTGRIPDHWPGGDFDLVVLSEVGYYCSDLDRLHDRVAESLSADGVLVACHWRHRADAHAHTADQVHEVLGRDLHLVVSHLERDFVLQVWTRTGRSVAEREGIV